MKDRYHFGKLVLFLAVVLLPHFAHADTTSGLVGYWTMNGKDINWTTNTMVDISGNGNTGTLTNMSTTSSPVVGKIGQGLVFDGVNDYVNVPPATSINNLSAMTISAWVKPLSFSDCNTNSAYVEKQSGAHGWLFQCLNSANKNVAFIVYYSGGSSNLSVTSANNVLELNKWVHLAVTWDGTTDHTHAIIYINGVPSAGASYSDATGSRIDDSVKSIHIGRNMYDGLYTNSIIDDVRIYNRALSADDILQLYNSGSYRVSASPVNAAKDGLVAHWTFDGKDTDWGSNTVTDVTGNGNTGTLTNMSTTSSSVVGRIGQGLYLDGTNDWIDIANPDTIPTTTPHTYLFWAKITANPASAQYWAFDIGNTGSLSNETYVIYNGGWRGSTGNSGDTLGGVTVLQNEWHLVSFTYDGSYNRLYLDGVLKKGPTASTPVAGTVNTAQIGNRINNSLRFNGVIDDLRIYNRALSTTEIQQLYNAGGSKIATSPVNTLSSGLVNYWTFDGKDVPNGVAGDLSGNGNLGRLMNISTSTFYTAGKLGQGFRFDGTNDYVVSMNNPITDYPFSFAVWIKAPTTNGQYTAVSYSNTTSNVIYYDIGTNGNVPTAKAYMKARSSAGDENSFAGLINLIPDRWIHLVAVFNSSTDRRIYVNGTLDTTASVSIPFVAGNNIAAGVTNRSSQFGFWPSGIDDVRIYSRALSSSEVTQLYNGGKTIIRQ